MAGHTDSCVSQMVGRHFQCRANVGGPLAPCNKKSDAIAHFVQATKTEIYGANKM